MNNRLHIRVNYDVKIDFESKRIHKAEYDEIPKDPEKYIAEKLGIEQSG
jgi:uncharacterized protein